MKKIECVEGNFITARDGGKPPRPSLWGGDESASTQGVANANTQGVAHANNSSRNKILRPSLWGGEYFIQPHQRTVWQEISPAERLRRSWQLRRKIKNLEKIHDKKIFPKV